MERWPEDVEFVSKEYDDWVACTWPDGTAVAYNKQTKRWCKLPHPDCPIVVFDPTFEARKQEFIAQQNALVGFRLK